jgi:hypothetical protein
LTAITRKSYSKTDIKFHTQLEADLAAGVRGGRKAKLIARSWVAINPKQLRRLWETQAIHATMAL